MINNSFATETLETRQSSLLLLDSKLKVVSANRSFYDTFQMTPEETVGHFIYELDERQWNIPNLRNLLENLIHDKTGSDYFRIEHNFPQIDSKIMSIDAHRLYSKPKKTGMILLTIDDITDQKKIEKQQPIPEIIYKEIFDSISEAICILDENGVFLNVNKYAEKMYQYPRECLIGKTQEFVSTPDKNDLNAFTNAIRKAYAGELQWYEFWGLKKDGTVFPEEINLTQGEYVGKRVVVALARDISNRRVLEEQLRQSQKMESIGELAGGAAHDFNNILTVINGYAQILMKKFARDDPVYESMKRVLEAGEKGARLTNQLLSFSRKQTINPEVLDLNEVIANIQNMLTRLISESIRLEAMLGEGIGAVKVDRGQLEQVIINIVINARDAMPNGGKLTLETKNVNFDQSYIKTHFGAPTGKYVMLAISDTGIGMDKEIQEHIFEPFFTTKEKGTGTGLGLSIVYGIVKQSGGEITVYSEKGLGTSFSIYFPDVQEGIISEEKDVLSKSFDLSGTETILIVEDEDMVREMVSESLRPYGYHLIEARDGNDAMLRCKEYKKPIDIVLTDIVMPQMSGKELIVRLRELNPGVKVLFMSGYTDKTVVNYGILDLHANFIHKPFSLVELIRKIREILNKD